jgi:hypothetical protein
MRNFAPLCFILLYSLSTTSSAQSPIKSTRNDEKEIFVMLNIDNTTLDRVFPCSDRKTGELAKLGLQVEKMQFEADKESSPNFIKMYAKLSNGTPLVGESEYMSKIQVRSITPEKFSVQECVVVRPGIRFLLEELAKTETQVHILLTSRNDDARTKNLHDHLDLPILGKSFKDTSTFVSRDWFRIKIKNGKDEVSVKSAQLLREKYKEVKPNDLVVLLDHIVDQRFIKSSNSEDFNIVVSKFYANKDYNKKKDLEEMRDILVKIRRFAQN